MGKKKFNFLKTARFNLFAVTQIVWCATLTNKWSTADIVIEMPRGGAQLISPALTFQISTEKLLKMLIIDKSIID